MGAFSNISQKILSEIIWLVATIESSSGTITPAASGRRGLKKPCNSAGAVLCG
jgi:hypothetical protein